MSDARHTWTTDAPRYPLDASQILNSFFNAAHRAGPRGSVDPRGFTPWEHEPDEFDRDAEEYLEEPLQLRRKEDRRRG